MAKNKLSLINKLLFLLNNIVAIALIISFFIPNLSPEKYGVLALLSLLTPLLIILNVIFIIYWIFVGFKKQLFLSLFVIILSLLFISPLYKFDSNNTKVSKNSISIMTYNVRKFNIYKWIKDENIHSKISEFIIEENPDIVVLQEYGNVKNFKLKYPYYSNPLIDNYRDTVMNNKFRTKLAIFSKYRIISEGILKDKKHQVSITYADIIKNRDTIRVYNFHLASLGIIPNKEYLGHDNSEKLIKRLRYSFKAQQKQINLLNNHIKNCKYKIIIAGDMNNTAYSWAYKNIKNDLQDSFLEAGNGFGKTYEFKKFPFRIDYIFSDKSMEFTNHKNYEKKYSDHYPISATIEIN